MLTFDEMARYIAANFVDTKDMLEAAKNAARNMQGNCEKIAAELCAAAEAIQKQCRYGMHRR